MSSRRSQDLLPGDVIMLEGNVLGTVSGTHAMSHGMTAIHTDRGLIYEKNDRTFDVDTGHRHAI